MELRHDGESVIYFYMVGERTLHGWRRGIQYGERDLRVVYSRIIPRIHVTVIDGSLSSPGDLWGGIDYLLRVFLLAGGALIGAAMVALSARLPSTIPRKWRLYLGLDREGGRG